MQSIYAAELKLGEGLGVGLISDNETLDQIECVERE